MAVPGAANALAARVIEQCGFEAVYVTGAGIANSYLGAPDIGLTSVTELRDHVEAISDAVSLPLVVDADTGFGNALNVARTVRMLERAGAAAIQLEDQVTPKRCGHFSDKAVIPTAEMVAKIHAAVDARNDDALCIVARTDARAIEGLQAAVERAEAYRQAGADVLFIEAPESVEELLSLPGRVPGAHIANMVEGGRTPLLRVDELQEFSIVLFANVALQAAIHGMKTVLTQVSRTGSFAGVENLISPWAERQGVVRKPEFDRLERRYGTESAEVAL